MTIEQFDIEEDTRLDGTRGLRWIFLVGVIMGIIVLAGFIVLGVHFFGKYKFFM